MIIILKKMKLKIKNIKTNCLQGEYIYIYNFK